MMSSVLNVLEYFQNGILFNLLGFSDGCQRLNNKVAIYPNLNYDFRQGIIHLVHTQNLGVRNVNFSENFPYVLNE